MLFIKWVCIINIDTYDKRYLVKMIEQFRNYKDFEKIRTFVELKAKEIA